MLLIFKQSFLALMSIGNVQCVLTLYGRRAREFYRPNLNCIRFVATTV